MQRNLAELRVDAGYKSQKNLADIVDVTRSAYAKWENGICYPPAQKIVQLSKALNVTEGEVIAAVTAAKQKSA